VTGDLDVTGRITTQDLTVTGSIELPDCPSGYARDPSADPGITVCVSASSGDEMVRVGDFWIDRYEASIWSDAGCGGTQYGAGTDYPGTFPDNGNFTAPLYACSVYFVTPSSSMTWFQAQAACAASGKHLCTNAEWQAAAEGTYDPPSGAETGNQCRIAPSNTGPRLTGQAGNTPGDIGSCISMWGAEDMVGNLWEWTSDWWTAGRTWQTAAAGQSQCPSGCDLVGGWHSGYGSDATWSVNGEAHDGTGYVNGIPAAALRGGSWDYGTRAGVFALGLTDGPSSRYTGYGARCCRQR
jgi:formylglycine-generating enzyme required for sulfatase activity